MTQRAGSLLLLVWSGVLGGPIGIAGQVTSGLRWSVGDVGIEANRYSVDPSQGNGLSLSRVRIWTSAQLSGEIFSQRFLSFNLSARPYGGSVRHERPDGEGLKGQEGQLLLSGSASMFSGRPLSLTLTGRRAEDRSLDALGTETAFRRESLSGQVRYANPYLPLSLEIRSETDDQEWDRRASGSIRSLSNLRLMTFRAQNRKFRMEYQQRRNEGLFPELAFDSRQFSANHLFRWGKGSSLQSSYRRVAIDRSATSSVSENWSEGLTLRHLESWASDFHYARSSIQAEGRRTDRVSYRVGSRVGPFRGALFQFRTIGSGVSLPTGSQRTLRFLPDAQFRIPLGGEVDLRGTVGGSFENIHRDVPVSGWALVLDEPHIVGPSGLLLLENPGVDLGTLSVTDSEQRIIYQEGFDYLVLRELSQTEILVLPGGRIQEGETILVDYRHEVEPRAQAKVAAFRHSLSLSWKALNVNFRKTVSNGDKEEILLFSPGLADQETLGLRFGLTAKGTTVSLSANRGWRSAGGLDTKTSSLGSSISRRFGRYWRGNLRASWEYQSGQLYENEVANISTFITMDSRRGFSASLNFRWSRYRIETAYLGQGFLSRKDELGGVTVIMDYLIGKTRVVVDVSGGLTFGDFRSRSNQVGLSLTRSF